MGHRKMYSGGLALIILIPLGSILIFFLYDYFRGIYQEKMLEYNTKEILLNVLNREGLETYDEYKEYAKRLLSEKGLDTDIMRFLAQDDGSYILVTYDTYMSVIGTISFGYIKNAEQTVHASYRGYYNEYKEAVVEKYEEPEEEEDLIEEDY